MRAVVICESPEQGLRAATELFARGSSQVLLEEKLEGIEVSATALVSAGVAMSLPIAMDYKRLREGNDGPNCDGMGTVCPHPESSTELDERIWREVLSPLAAGLAKDGLEFTGFSMSACLSPVLRSLSLS